MSLTETDRQPTRAELNKIDDQLELVESGKEKLEEVQEQLIDEFMNTFERWQDKNKNMGQTYSDAEKKFEMTQAMEGGVRLRSVARARKNKVKISSSINNIAGVRVPSITTVQSAESDITERGYGILGSSARIDEVASSYEEVIDSLVKLAELETAMKKILDEIERVSRRVNAFEYQIIPNLQNEKRVIERKLFEQERQETYQLKMIKDKKEEEEED